MSKLIISDPQQRLDDPEIAGKAKAEMMRFNAHSESNGRVSGKFETGISVAEMFASFGNPNFGGPRQPLPNIRSLVSDPLNPIQPDWNSAFAGGTLERIRGLIQSNYSDSSRPSLKTAVRHWARFCAKLGISVFRPQVADNWEAKAMEEMILMLFLGYIIFEVRVQGSTRASKSATCLNRLQEGGPGCAPPCSTRKSAALRLLFGRRAASCPAPAFGASHLLPSLLR